MVYATADANCVFLQIAEPGGRFSCVRDNCPGPLHSLDREASRCGYPGEPLQEVERHPFSCEKHAHRRANADDYCSWLHPRSFLHGGLDHSGRVELGKDRIDHRKAGDHEPPLRLQPAKGGPVGALSEEMGGHILARMILSKCTTSMLTPQRFAQDPSCLSLVMS